MLYSCSFFRCIQPLVIISYFRFGDLYILFFVPCPSSPDGISLDSAGIEKTVHLTPQTARGLRDGKEEVIPAEQVKVGDRIRVLPGESVPDDGVIASGQLCISVPCKECFCH